MKNDKMTIKKVFKVIGILIFILLTSMISYFVGYNIGFDIGEEHTIDLCHNELTERINKSYNSCVNWFNYSYEESLNPTNLIGTACKDILFNKTALF